MLLIQACIKSSQFLNHNLTLKTKDDFNIIVVNLSYSKQKINIMNIENRVKIVLTEEQKTAIEGGLKAIKDTLEPILISLTPQEKQSMLILGDKSISFVNKNLMFADQKPEFIPSYLDIKAWRIDMQAKNDLAPYNAEIQEINSLLKDTIALCGNEAYLQALTYYNSVKQAAKSNVPGAKPIYEELKQQFPNYKKPEEEEDVD